VSTRSQFQNREVAGADAARANENSSHNRSESINGIDESIYGLNTTWYYEQMRKDSGDVLLEVLTLTRHTKVERPKLMDALVVDCIRDIFGMKEIARK